MKTPRHNVSENRLTTTVCNKRLKTSMNGSENSEPIPTDLIIEVLSRLPAKSIARIRCVSKHWASILPRPDFSEMFLTKSSACPKLLFACKKKGELHFFSSSQVENPENSSIIAANYHMKFPLHYESSQVFRPVHGLICLKHARVLFGRRDTVLELCNPSTGQSLTLPKVKTRRIRVTSFLGYDPIGKQFKLLSMTSLVDGYKCFSEEHQILTLGTGKLSWKMIKCSITHYPLCDDGRCINGVLYYPAVERKPNTYMIICFHIRSEKFKFIKADFSVCRTTLVDYKGKLAALQFDNGYGVISGRSRNLSLWILEDLQKSEWSNHIYVLPPLWKDIVSDAKLYIVGVTRTAEIVLSMRHTSNLFYLIYYNLERTTIIKVGIQGMNAFKGNKVLAFLYHIENLKLVKMSRASISRLCNIASKFSSLEDLGVL